MIFSGKIYIMIKVCFRMMKLRVGFKKDYSREKNKVERKIRT